MLNRLSGARRIPCVSKSEATVSYSHSFCTMLILCPWPGRNLMATHGKVWSVSRPGLFN